MSASSLSLGEGGGRGLSILNLLELLSEDEVELATA